MSSWARRALRQPLTADICLASRPENFSTTLPQVPLETLDPIRLKFISDLKADIKAQHIEIAEDFNLEEKLRELQRLTEEADARAAAGESNRGDIWKEELDIGNALDAKGVEIQSENVAKMTRELEQVSSGRQIWDEALDTDIGRRPCTDTQSKRSAVRRAASKHGRIHRATE